MVATARIAFKDQVALIRKKGISELVDLYPAISRKNVPLLRSRLAELGEMEVVVGFVTPETVSMHFSKMGRYRSLKAAYREGRELGKDWRAYHDFADCVKRMERQAIQAPLPVSLFQRVLDKLCHFRCIFR